MRGALGELFDVVDKKSTELELETTTTTTREVSAE